MLVTIFLFYVAIPCSRAEVTKDKVNLIYDSQKDANYNPIQVYVNGAFDVTQNPHYFNQNDFFKKHREFWFRIRSPLSSIENYGGAKHFFGNELFSSRVVPNLTLHTIGSGYDFRMMKEYFEANDVTHSGIYAGLVTFLIHAGNEALETSSPRLDPTDHIADIYIFDAMAIPLFLNDDIARFFVQDLGLVHWHFLPTYLPKEENFVNAGLNYVIRPPSLGDKIRPMIYFGMQVMGGASYFINSANTLSIASGVYYTDPLEGKTQWSWGAFYEQNNRLAASLLINSTNDYDWRLNLYPTLLNYKKHSFGMFLANDDKNGDPAMKTKEWIMGLLYELPIGLGMTL